MFIHYRSQGFILKKENRGEADQLFTIYTKDFGKLEIFGKAIRKISSKLRSGVEIFYLSEIEFIQGRSYKTLTDAVSIEKFRNLKKDLKRLRIAYKISEVLDNLIKGQEPDEKIWNLQNEVFNKLNNLQFTIYNLQLIYFYFFWNFLSILGYQPELYNCSLCQEKLKPEKLYFNPKEGGIICQNCFKKVKSGKSSQIFQGKTWEGKEIKPEVVKILRIILARQNFAFQNLGGREKNWPTLSKLKIEKPYLKSLENVSNYYLSFILNKDYS